MKRNTHSSKQANLKKTILLAIVINALQIIAVISVFLYVLLHSGDSLSRTAELGLLFVCMLIVSWGAVIDIKDAFAASQIAEQTRMIEEAYSQLESLNGTLRKQRHDFMNHLQVVFSLTELGEYDEAMQYIERIYGDIQKVGSSLKTSIPALNALIAAKSSDCASNGITLVTDIRSDWKDISVHGWELCRIFGNLIDNARDALLSETNSQCPTITLRLFQQASGDYCFSISNNGPAIPPQTLDRIFDLGYTTKSNGHGSGLAIVREIIESAGGSISVRSDSVSTEFFGTIPSKEKGQ